MSFYESKSGIKLNVSTKALYGVHKDSVINVVGAYGIEIPFRGDVKKLLLYNYNKYDFLCEMEMQEDGTIWLYTYSLFRVADEIISIVEKNLDDIYDFINKYKLSCQKLLYDASRESFVMGEDFTKRRNIDFTDFPPYVVFSVTNDPGPIIGENSVYIFDNSSTTRMFSDACILSLFNNLEVLTEPKDTKKIETFAASLLSILSGFYNGIEAGSIEADITSRHGDSISYVKHRLEGVDLKNNTDAKIRAQNFDRNKLIDLLERGEPVNRNQRKHQISKIIEMGLDKYIKEYLTDGELMDKIYIDIDMQATGISQMFISSGAAFITPMKSLIKIDISEFEDMLNSTDVFLCI